VINDEHGCDRLKNC